MAAGAFGVVPTIGFDLLYAFVGQLIDLHRQRELHQVQTDGLRRGVPRRLFLRG